MIIFILYIFKLLIKYNKEIQNRLQITREIFFDNSDLPRYEYGLRSKIIEHFPPDERRMITCEDLYMCLLNTCSTLIFLIYLLIYSILLATLDLFDESNTIEKYDQDSLDKIEFLNISLFILLAIFIFSHFIIMCFVSNRLQYDYGCKKYLKSVLMIFFLFVHLAYEGLIIWKLVLSYSIISVSLTWFIALDFIFIIINFLYILYHCFITFLFFKELGKNISTESEFILISYNKMKVKTFILPQDFPIYNKTEKKNYISKNAFTKVGCISEISK